MPFHLNLTGNLCTKLLLLKSVQFSSRGNVGVGFTGTKTPCKIFRTHLEWKCSLSFVEINSESYELYSIFSMYIKIVQYF